MADITPLNVTTAIVTSAPSVPAVEPNAPATALVQALPQKLANLTRPVHINGPVTSLLDNGVFTIRTLIGDIVLKFPPLADGSKNPLTNNLAPLIQSQKPINIAVQPGNPPAQALVFLPPPPMAATSGQTSSSPGAAPAIVAQPAASLSSGATLSAVVLPSSVGEQLSSSPASAPSSSSLPASAAPTSAATSPQTASVPILSSLKSIFGPTLTPPQSLSVPTAETPATAAAPSANVSPALLKPGTELMLKINTIAPPQTPLPAVSLADQFIATVIGKGAEGQLLLSTGDSTLYVKHCSDLPVGSRLVLTLIPPRTEESFTIPAKPTYDVSALQQLVAALNEIDLPMAQQLVQTRIPQSNRSLPGMLLFFFNALGAEGIHGWLGHAAINRLEREGKGELVRKLSDEMAQAGGTTRDPTVGSWQSHPLPLYHDHKYHLLHLYVHKDDYRKPGKDGENQTETKTRFLINLNMSRLGAMQMDGLSQRKQLDMIVRSEQELPGRLPDELRNLYVHTLEALALTGSILFQTGRKNWLVLEREKGAATAGMVT